MNVFVWIEQHNGTPVAASWEAIGLARQLGDTVTALVLGQGVDDIAQAAIHYGADAVLKADDATLAQVRFEPYVTLIAHLVQQHNPDIVLAAATISGREVLAGAAADVNAAMLPDVIELSLEDGKLSAARPVLGGKVLSVEAVTADGPQFATLRSRAFPMPEPDANRSGTITEVSPVLADDVIASRVESAAELSGQVSLTDASVIVAGGRGVGGPEGFAPVKELADVLGGALAASRAAVDAGWIPYEHQVGQTGKVVSPDLYIAAGISGAIQHQAGMRTSKVIVAINRDADAPIFRLARYGIVGDLFDVLPALAEAFRNRLG
ncbi:MAG: electron transfer flavoprotein subunit alpha/FixB family protein [Anaerolineae bacterium]|nr:electron transfer flavoprotein subunit alpha/FixB family protein [Anaerolineae bacterium]